MRHSLDYVNVILPLSMTNGLNSFFVLNPLIRIPWAFLRLTSVIASLFPR